MLRVLGVRRTVRRTIVGFFAPLWISIQYQLATAFDLGHAIALSELSERGYFVQR